MSQITDSASKELTLYNGFIQHRGRSGVQVLILWHRGYNEEIEERCVILTYSTHQYESHFYL